MTTKSGWIRHFLDCDICQRAIKKVSTENITIYRIMIYACNEGRQLLKRAREERNRNGE